KEEAAEVRLQLAATAQHRLQYSNESTERLLRALMSHAEDADDPCIPLMIWLAYEPFAARKPDTALRFLRGAAPGNALITNDIVARTMRRLTATDRWDYLEQCLGFLTIEDPAVRRRALEGLVIGLEGRQTDTPMNWKEVFANLSRDRAIEVKRLVRRVV